MIFKRYGVTTVSKYVKDDIIQTINHPDNQFLVLGITATADAYKVRSLTSGKEFFWIVEDCNGVTEKVN